MSLQFLGCGVTFEYEQVILIDIKWIYFKWYAALYTNH